MTRESKLRWSLLGAANVAVWCVLSLQQSQGQIRPNGGFGGNNQLTAAGELSATQQRAEIIAQLKEIKTAVNILVQYRRNESLPQPDPLQP
jgi:hypothetical protein